MTATSTQLENASSTTHEEMTRLANLAAIHHASYCAAQPFPHIVLDDVFETAILDEVLSEFPDPRGVDWERFSEASSIKLATKSEQQMGPATRSFLRALNSSAFIEFLETLTGITGLIPDPHLVGGGLHQIERGGFLKIHADFNWHDRLKLDRRVNVLIYLNKDWKEEYGGQLELWDTKMTECKVKALPIFNRLVVFNTTSDSYHGHPEPLQCPESRSRKSIAMYYYTNGRPIGEIHGRHSTLYQRRKDDSYLLTMKRVAVDLVPPILVKMARKFGWI
jgi:hypothetical protein